MIERDEELADVHPADLAVMEAIRTGNLTMVEMSPEDQAALNAQMDIAAQSLPDNPDDMLVVTSIRLTVGMNRQLKALAERIGGKPTVMMRRWVEEGILREVGAETDPVENLKTAIRHLQRAQAQMTKPEHKAA